MSDTTTANISPQLQVLLQDGKTLKRGPGLTRVNGIGNVPGGKLEDPALSPYHLQSVWFTFFLIPIFLEGIYLSGHPVDKNGRVNTASYYFYRKLTFKGIRSAFGKGAVSKIVNESVMKYLMTVVLMGVVGGVIYVGYTLYSKFTQ